MPTSIKKSKLKIALQVLIGVLLIIILSVWIYLQLNTYKADDIAIKNLISSEEIKITQTDSLITFDNTKKESDQAFIIYPGGLVEPKAYSSLCRLIAENFDQCFIPSMLFNFAILTPNKAEEIIKANPEISNWSLIGHSLGGPAATRFIESHPNAIEKLVLLASYSDIDISDDSIQVLSILGSNDGLVDPDTYEKYKLNLPSDTEFKIIEGGNHSQMGDYGFQKGDGKASIVSAEQRMIIIQAVKQFLSS